MEFSIQIANLGKYTAGILSDAKLSFPTTMQQVQEALRAIGVDGLRYAEIIICDYSISIPGLASRLEEYSSIDELNYLASRLQDLSTEERSKFAAAVEHGEYGGNLQDLINLTYNLDCYELLPSIRSYEDYGTYLIDHRREFYLPQKARFYFDYSQYGEDTLINEGGVLTPQGYIRSKREVPFIQIYDGVHFPAEYKVFQYPLQEKVRCSHPVQKPHMPTR